MRSKVLVAVMAAVLIGAVVSVVPAGAATGSRTATAAKFTGDPIKVGVTYMCDAPTPPALCEIGPSATAAAKTVNSKGGVKTGDGETHQVEVILCNNKNDRTLIADCARQFVEEQVAFASGAVLYGDELVPILAEGGVPYFAPTCASDCNTEASAENTYLTSFTLGLFEGLTQELVDAGFKKMKVVAQGTGVGLGALTQPIAEAGGATLEVVEAPTENPNWAQIAEEAADNADVIYTVMAEQEMKAFLDAYSQAGKDVPVTSVIGIITNDLIAATGANSPITGSVSTGFFPPPQDPAWADFRKGMKKYAKNTQLEPAGQQIWLSIQLATTIMEGIDGPVTAESFTAAADATTDIPTLGGKFPAGKSFQSPEGIFPWIFSNDYWGPLKITSKKIGNGKGAKFTPAPSA